ncbi:serine--tRNA ligase [Candidatus Falkowbacteria bacterium RIFCSPLOWO2_12_FULL_45_13]|uniref:Serine--tRNA ligase n=1 Tax=Candidatus Falkowbacteria bacterium RIFCSPLOWO2_12_FULL_45_13 TaxID=1797991 RepID=A0A1F5SXZ2_9BACT|nr:MAG: serine--tRNA ligase [Candidatus Falkowbacteria bacterium RIFCSPLOWO2_12_FULL_45_13]
MLDIKFIKQNRAKVEQAAKNKNVKINLEKLFELDDRKKKLQTKIGELRTEKNKLADSFKESKPTGEQIAQGKKIKNDIVSFENELEDLSREYTELLYQLPNIVSDDTPVGPDETGNKILRRIGEIPKFDFPPEDHVKLGRLHKIIDTEKSTAISGLRFNYLFGEAALLQFALVQFVFETLADQKIISQLAKKSGNPSAKTFIPVVPPVIAKAEIMKKMDRFDPVDDRYYLQQDDALLVGSAEHTMGPLHLNEIIKEEDLPIRYIGYSTAFRREAGSYGKDTTGILRRHQFDKLEMECFTMPQHGLLEQEFIVAAQEYLVSQLEIPYQVVLKCTGDIGGKADYRAVDIECYLPGQGKYRETHTADYMTDFQARRLNTRYKARDGHKSFVHMNDATAFAIGRTLIAIMENHQQADGSIKIPQALHKYLPGGLKVIGKKKK